MAATSSVLAGGMGDQPPPPLSRYQQQPQQTAQQHRFGGPDSRASFSERRLMQHSASLRTAHNHPQSSSGGHWQQHHQSDPHGGRSFQNPAGLSALSRSNGSLAASNHQPNELTVHHQHHSKDTNGNSSQGKPRSRTQVICSSLFLLYIIFLEKPSQCSMTHAISGEQQKSCVAKSHYVLVQMKSEIR